MFTKFHSPTGVNSLKSELVIALAASQIGANMRLPAGELEKHVEPRAVVQHQTDQTSVNGAFSPEKLRFSRLTANRCEYTSEVFSATNTVLS